MSDTPQPKWRCIVSSDCDRLLIDETGVYPPELERAEEFDRDGKTRFLVFRVVLDRLSKSPTQVALSKLRPKMGHVPTLVDVIDHAGKEHHPWFEDDQHKPPLASKSHCVVVNHSAFCNNCGSWVSYKLTEAALSSDVKPEELRRLFCSEDPKDLMYAYTTIAGYHGWENFDAYPLELTEKQLDRRWDDKPIGEPDEDEPDEDEPDEDEPDEDEPDEDD